MPQIGIGLRPHRAFFGYGLWTRAKDIGGQFIGETAKEAESYQVRLRGIHGFQLLKCIIQRQQPLIAGTCFAQVVGHFDAMQATAPPDGMTSARVLDQDPSHRFGRSAKEVPSAIPFLWGVIAHQPQVGFVHKLSRLQ